MKKVIILVGILGLCVLCLEQIGCYGTTVIKGVPVIYCE